MRAQHGTVREREGGQVLVIFALALTVILIALALVFDGAQALVLRRQLQNTADAAALAGANIVQANGGCSATLVSNTATDGSNKIYLAVRQNVMDNLGVTSAGADAMLKKSDGSNAVECATDQSWYSTYAVKVSLLSTNPTYFGAIAGVQSIGVGVTATAFNGPVNGGKFSVVMLDPCHNGQSYCSNGATAWSAQRNGCPSIQFNGGPNVTFEGSLQSDSACQYSTTLSFTGAVGTSGSGNATITLANTSSGQATIRMVGTYNPGGFSNISPSGQIYTNQPWVPDPFAGLPTPSFPTSGANAWLQCPSSDARCPSNGGSTSTVNNCFVLSPGIYNGGLTIKSDAYMKPGLYVLNGGGVTFTGQGKLYSVNSSYVAASTTCLSPETVITSGGVTGTNWELNLCQQATVDATTHQPIGQACGVMIYNKCSATTVIAANCGSNGSAPFGAFSQTAGASVMLRQFCSSNDTNAVADCTSTKFAPTEQQGSNATIRRYRNLVLWQASQPAPSSSFNQPDVTLGGNATLILQGTVYAPNAFVKLTGNCGGSGGTNVDLTLQFIAYDLQIAGSCTYTFHYRTSSFATPSGYGLVR